MERPEINNSIFISVVIPIFNEEENLPVLTERLLNVLSQYNKFEIIYINDGSTDNSPNIIEELCDKNKSIKLVNFSRNFGHQAAISAGIDYAEGDAVIVMDGDLQDPPELLPEFIEKWKEGYDVVYAIRKHRRENILKRTAYYIFYRLLNRISEINIPLDTGDFSIMDRKIIDHIKSLPEKNRFVRGIRSWIGFKHIGLEYSRQKRNLGEPKYTTGKLIKLALDGFYSFSRKPLKFALQIGAVITISSFMVIMIILYLKLISDMNISGSVIILIAVLLLGGIQLIMLGIMGEYIGRIYDEVKGRPSFIVKSTKNIKE